MRYRTLFLTILTGVGVASCGENAPPAANTGAGAVADARPRQLPPPPGGPVASAAVTAAPAVGTSPRPQAATAAPPAAPEVLPPKDARYTLLCYTVRGAGHVQLAADLKQSLVQQTNRKDWYVVHGQEASNLYFGFYRSVSDPADAKETDRARRDRELVAGKEMLVALSGGGQELAKPFEKCAFVELAAPDPETRPEWNLANVDKDKAPKDESRAFWSLQVMAFRGVPERKAVAVQVVEELRKEGVPAYYFHGDSISSVCVGVWPRGAVKEQTATGEHTFAGGNKTVIVASEPLPDSMVPKRLDGKEVVVVAPKLEVLDPDLANRIRQFPDHVVNGNYQVNPTRSGGEVRNPTFLVLIPRPKGNGYYDFDEEAVPPPPTIAGVGAGNNPRNAAAVPLPPGSLVPATPGSGRLRRLGEN